MSYILGIDEGTTSARVVLFDTKLNKIVKISRGRFTQYYPTPDAVEHNAEEIWKIVNRGLKECLEDIDPKKVAGIGITNQRETIVAWSIKTNSPLTNALCWQDNRTAEFCKKLKASKFANIIKEKTGLLPDSYFSSSKIKWLLENEPNVKKALKENDLRVGTIESFLVAKLTGGESFVSDVTNASRTQLLNIKTLTWDDELLKIFGVPKHILPNVVSNSEIVGYYNYKGYKIPICGLCGDQQSSLFGQGCVNAGEMKNTYGTGAFLLMNTGSKIVNSNNLLTTVALKIKNKVTYALEGSIYNCGTAVDWATEIFNFKTARNLDECAAKVENSLGVYFIPSFNGLGAPYWNMDPAGMLYGLTRGTTKNHIARAVLDGIAYRVYDVSVQFEKLTGRKIKMFKADGGVTNNRTLMQFQADLIGCNITLSHGESTVLGAIYLAGLASGVYKDENEILSKIVTLGSFAPAKLPNKNQLIAGWEKAIKKVCL